MEKNKPQSAEEIVAKMNMSKRYDEWIEGYVFEDKEEVIKHIRGAQKEAIQYALQVAARSAIAYNKGKFPGDINPDVDIDSILSLEEQILKDLGHE